MNETYKIPGPIIDNIPKEFYFAFASNLRARFGPWIFEGQDEIKNAFYVTGSVGWMDTFKATAARLGLSWLVEYYDSLDWYDSDLFDDHLSDLLFEHHADAK